MMPGDRETGAGGQAERSFPASLQHHQQRAVVAGPGHGLPVENEIDKKLDIKRRDQVLQMGIDKYNEECRSIVTRYVEEWEKVITRTGRWIDFRNDYKTMDLPFMESVWWVFAQLFDKNLVYKGFKVFLAFPPLCALIGIL